MTCEQLRFAARGGGESPVLVVYVDDVGGLRVAEVDAARVVPEDLIAADYGVAIEGSKALVIFLD